MPGGVVGDREGRRPFRVDAQVEADAGEVVRDRRGQARVPQGRLERQRQDVGTGRRVTDAVVVPVVAGLPHLGARPRQAPALAAVRKGS